MTSELLVILISIGVILTVFMPLFIFTIRGQVISINKKMSLIIKLLEAQAPEPEPPKSFKMKPM